MKRVSADSGEAQVDPQSSKKLKVDDTDLFHPSLHRKLVDLLRPDSDNSDNGYITGRIFMIWPARNGVHSMYFEAKEDDKTYRFGIQLSGKYIDYVDVFNFKCHAPFHLALKGVTVEHKQESSAHNFAPLSLIYNKGLAVKFITREGTEDLVVDTWQLEKERCPSSTWYSTPRNPRYIPRVSRAVVGDVATGPNENRSMVPQPAFAGDAVSSHSARSDQLSTERSRAQQTSGNPYKSSTSSVSVRDGFENEKTLASNAQSGHAPLDHRDLSSTKPPKGEPNKITKSKARRMKKLKRDLEATAVAATSNVENCVPLPVLKSDVQSVKPSAAGDVHSHIPIAPPPVSRTTSMSTVEEKLRKDALQFRAGCHTEAGESYTPLVEVKEGTSMFNAIGVVTSVRSAVRTRTNEWSVSFTIADFSNLEADQGLGYLQNEGLTVNCFQDKYLEWLPSPSFGNVIILRRLKVSNFRGTTMIAIGYKDKLRWTHFNAETRVAYHGDRGSAPESERTDNGFGYEYSPFWTPQAIEIDYCNRLANWWQDLQRFLGKDIITIQVGAGTRQTRQHRLIADASPDLPPDGFFDCTAEILRGFENDNGPYCLYVTDYTVNDQMAKVESSWCPQHLKNRALRIDAWDKAGQLARTMMPGEFWFLRNMKMKINRLGYLEAKLQEAEKVIKLNDKDLSSQPFLKALLDRKKEFYETHNMSDGPCNKFDTKLIQDVNEDITFFNCTVEVLHIHHGSSQDTELYVTDYSFHPDLPSFSAEWSAGLESRVVNILLEGGQKSKAMDLAPGRCYTIKNLRMIKRANAKHMHGRLGGDEQLITQIDDMMDDDVKTLLKRKDQWKREIERARCASMSVMLHTEVPPNGSCSELDTKLIQDVDGDNTFFNCTAEVLHIHHGSSQDTELYVTDYSFHPDLPSFSAEWSARLEGRVVKILLEGGQKSKAMDLVLGRCYTIKNLRMIKRADKKHMHGRLGGDEQLITQIDDMTDDDVKTLLKQKYQWKREIERDRCASTPVVPHTEVPSNDVLDSAAVVASEPAQQSNTILIRDVLASDTCPNIFRIVGRVTDYLPFDLHDFVFLWCTNCKTEVPSNCRQCLKCDDLATSNVKCLYRFFLNVEDDSGAAVQVAVCNEECPLLKGLPPVDLRDDKDALKTFAERLRPVIGNLDDAHKSWLDKTNIDVVTPKLEFTIDSFDIEDGKARSYSLIDHRTP